MSEYAERCKKFAEAYDMYIKEKEIAISNGSNEMTPEGDIINNKEWQAARDKYDKWIKEQE